MEKFIIFESIGEISRDVMATAVVEALHRANPDKKIVVLSLHPEVWLHNPNVFRVYKSDATQYFHEDFIADTNALIHKHDPYLSSDFVYKRKHIIDIWCEQCGVRREDARPAIFFTPREKEIAERVMEGGRPICLLQTKSEHMGLSMPYPTPWSRNLSTETAQKVVDVLVRKNYRVAEIRRDDQPGLLNTDRITLDNRLLFAALPYTKTRLFIDSSLHHTAAALNTESVITWNTLSPVVHGYDSHINILPDATNKEYRELQDRYIESFRASQFLPSDVPTDYQTPIHDPDMIIEKMLTL